MSSSVAKKNGKKENNQHEQNDHDEVQSTSEAVEMNESMSSGSDDEDSTTSSSSRNDEDDSAKAGYTRHHERIELPAVSTDTSSSNGVGGTIAVPKRQWETSLLGYNPETPAARLPLKSKLQNGAKRTLKRNRSSGSTTISQRESGSTTKYMRNGEPQYEVEELLARRTRNQVVEYNVKWKDYVETTWEPVKNLSNCQFLIDRFEKKEKIAYARQGDSIGPIQHPSKILRRPPAPGGKLKANDASNPPATPSPSTFFTVREAPLQREVTENGGAKKRGRKRKTTLAESGTPETKAEEAGKKSKETDLEREVAYELIVSDMRCGDQSVIIVSVTRGRNGESPRAQLFSKTRNIEVWLPTELIAKYQPKLLIDHYERYLNLTP